jgi:hypothetical protein
MDWSLGSYLLVLTVCGRSIAAAAGCRSFLCFPPPMISYPIHRILSQTPNPKKWECISISRQRWGNHPVLKIPKFRNHNCHGAFALAILFVSALGVPRCPKRNVQRARWIGKCVLFILDRQFFPQFQRCDFGKVALGLNVWNCDCMMWRNNGGNCAWNFKYYRHGCPGCKMIICVVSSSFFLISNLK